MASGRGRGGGWERRPPWPRPVWRGFLRLGMARGLAGEQTEIMLKTTIFLFFFFLVFAVEV
jgi:hypothetical protein